MKALLWFKRDLRVADRPALAHAAGLGLPFPPVCVVEPDYWALSDTSQREWAFIAESLSGLRRALARRHATASCARR